MKFITISRQLGTGGAEIARQVAARLGYKFHDTASIDHVAKEMGFIENVAGTGERTPSFFKRYFTHKPAITQARLNSVIYELAKHGDGVFLGRGGHILLKSFSCAMHVRIIASKDKRAENLLEQGFSRQSALRYIEQSDRERAGFIKYAFGREWDDPGLYDVLLNMDKLSKALAVDTIVAMAGSDEITACSIDSMKALAGLALTARVEAAIEEAGLSYGPSMSVSVSVEEMGKVRLEGAVGDRVIREKAEAVAKGVKGVESIDNRIRVWAADRHA